MNSLEAFNIIEAIAATSSKNEKQALVAENLDSFFRSVLTAALDPLISYNISKCPLTETNGTGLFDDATWAILNDLATRRLTGNNAIAAVQAEMERLEPKS